MALLLPSLLDFDAFFFDFDGLLVDTEPLHYRAYQKMLATRDLTLPWDFSTYCHYAHQKTEVFAEAMFLLFPSLKKEQPDWMVLREEKVAIYQALLMTESIDLMAGVECILQFLAHHNKSMYVVTNATRSQIEAIRPQHEVLKLIKGWIAREDYLHSKPAPDGYLKAIEMHGPCRGIGFEDAIRGIQALKATPLTPVLILPNNYPQPNFKELDQVYVFSSFHDLLTEQF